MIEVERVSKFYGPVAAIHDVSFQVDKGEIVGFLGPNGAGKTTTMRVLTCFHPPSSGTARVAGFDVFKDSLEVRRRVGYLPESVPLYTDQTVWSYLNFIAEVRGIGKSQRKAQVARVMEECGLDQVGDRLIGRLSKGYRQRVGIAQALVHRPQVLILDEPTIGLDPKQIIEIRQLIRGLAGERTVIVSTHILPEVSMVCSRALIINQGRIVAADTPENLTLRLQKGMRIQLQVRAQEPSQVEAALRSVRGVSRVTWERDVSDGVRAYMVESTDRRDLRAALAREIIGRGWDLLELRSVEMSLEDIFLQLVTEEPQAESVETTH
ncbi:MAG: ATP-binding cassette domain-containing protein [bacterium]